LKNFPISLIIIFLIFIEVMTGCAKLERAYPERNFYMLNFSRNSDLKTSIRHKDKILVVNHFSVSPGSIGAEFTYRVGEESYKSDFYNQFFRPPGALISEEVRRWFIDSELFQYVLYSSPSDIKPDYLLDGNINELYGDFREGSKPKAVLGIQCFLTDQQKSPAKIIFYRNYRKEILIGSNSPRDLVQGWNEALTQILTELDRDLSQINLQVSN